MRHKTVFIPLFFSFFILVVILLMPLASGAQTVQAITQNNSGTTVQVWQQVNFDGFGDANNIEVLRLAQYDDYLFASTENSVSGGEVWRSTDGLVWEQVNLDGFGFVTNKTAHVEGSFQGKLYVGTANTVIGAEIWRCDICDGSDWEQVVEGGFDNLNNNTIERTMVFSDKLFATTNNATGVEIWKSSTGDLGSWTQSNVDGFGNPKNVAAWAAAIYLDNLFIATANPGGIEVWRTTGNDDWGKVSPVGFGGTGNIPWDLVAIGDKLYLSTGNINGAQIWRCTSCDGSDWEQIVNGDFGEDAFAVVLTEYQNKIIAATTYNEASILDGGIDVWETEDSVNWSMIHSQGFGDTNNIKVGTGGMAVYGKDLYIGTRNIVTGAEIWRMQQPYSVALSTDQSYFGPVGGQVSYTLTVSNNGTMTDNIDLIATGEIWTTTLSTSTVNLAPSTSTIFTVTVSIPPDAGYLDSDSVTITATSQGDINSTDSATLTTTSILEPEYGVTLSADDSLSGPAGEQVIYNLTVRNTGNVVDTFNLKLTENNWTTTPSTNVVVLNAASSQVITIAVTIPPEAIASESDQVTVQVTSQGDSSKTDSAVLTTVSLGKFEKIYFPLILLNSLQ